MYIDMGLCILLTVMVELKYFNMQVVLYIVIILVIKLSAVIIHFEAHMI